MSGLDFHATKNLWKILSPFPPNATRYLSRGEPDTFVLSTAVGRHHRSAFRLTDCFRIIDKTGKDIQPILANSTGFTAISLPLF